MVTLRSFAKAVAHRTGALHAYHAARNAGTLTVLMFHRSLPGPEIASTGADPRYTVTPEFLAHCVEFLRQHYSLVSLGEVRRFYRGEAGPPSNAALITFDDGWRDNLLHAAPVLAGVPWVVFVATDAMRGPDCWWQETLLATIRSGKASATELLHAANESHGRDTSDCIEHDLLIAFAGLPEEQRQRLLAPYAEQTRPHTPIMLAPEELLRLKRFGAEIGAHGASHLPLSRITDPEADLRQARDCLMGWLGTEEAPALSFPHGRYDAAVLKAARKLGFDPVFSSDPIINRFDNRGGEGLPLGRIAIDMHDLADPRGKLIESRLATWLFLRQREMRAGAA